MHLFDVAALALFEIHTIGLSVKQIFIITLYRPLHFTTNGAII